MEEIKNMVENQRKYFEQHETIKVNFRKEQLIALQDAIRKNEARILLALKKDLNKSNFESYATELGIVYDELHYMIKHVEKLSKPNYRKTPIMHFHSKSYVYRDPYGCVLIMSPWNYPFQLTLVPLIGAIAAGNCVTVKPSNYSVETSKVINEILSVFPDEYINVIEGGREANQQLLEQKFDYIFFTGSPAVGKLVMEKASTNLTPITLELGGKSPCIIDETANIDLAAKRVAWGKFLNAGQTCVAPDYILVNKKVKNQFINCVKKYVALFYGVSPQTNSEYPKIINQHHFDRLTKIIENSEHVIGGQYNLDTHQIAPTIIDFCTWESEVMQDEIFGPILPIISFENIESIIKKINDRPKPLALYLFTSSKQVESLVLAHTFYGGGCINDTVVHLANSNLPFGGVGNSGMGSYHGKESFNTFSHAKSILKKSSWIDIPLRYAPHKNKLNLLKKIMRR